MSAFVQMPEARLDDQYKVKVSSKKATTVRVKMDAGLLENCVAGSIEVFSVTPNTPAICAAHVEGDVAVIEVVPQGRTVDFVIVRVSGVLQRNSGRWRTPSDVEIPIVERMLDRSSTDY